MGTRDTALDLLRRLTGDDTSSFRDGQAEAIEALVDDRKRVLVVQRTGWGKSAVYFVATRLLRDAGAGPTLLVSPLLALMRNQIQMATRAGVRAATINSDNTEDWDAIEEAVKDGAVDLLLISPERLNNVRFRQHVLPSVVRRVGLLVVDEAHCISDWGHDFRPDYRRIARVLGMLPAGVPVLCTTATANDRVVADIVDQLGHDLVVLRGTLERESLALAVVDRPQAADRLAWLATVIPTLTGSGIVYCLTVADTERVAAWLRRCGIDATAYSGESESSDRLLVEEALLTNRVKAVVATSALGMGFDKPDLGWVVHYQAPGSPIAYYQQVGRAGRGVERADAVLLRGHEDADIQDYFIRTAFPPKEQAERVVALLEQRAEPVSIGEIEREVNARRSRIEAMLKVLEVEGAVERSNGKWLRTLKPWAYDTDRVERVTALRRAEQAAMLRYATTDDCRMALLRNDLDDRTTAPCRRCDNCAGLPPHIGVEVDRDLVIEAVGFLRSSSLVIEPRKQWPPGLGEPRGRISAETQLRPGRALGVYNDGGWGSVVKQAKYAGADRTFPDELVDAAARLVRDWSPEPAPTWLTFVPSSTATDLFADLATRLGARLNLSVHDLLRRRRASRPQNEMENSAQQFRNVSGAFAIEGAVPAGPVLLVDDTVDSRWTLTVVGVALREAGAGPVHPVVLSKAVSD